MAKATLFFFSSFPIGIKKPFLQSKSPRCPPRKLLKEGGEKERLAARQKNQGQGLYTGSLARIVWCSTLKLFLKVFYHNNHLRVRSGLIITMGFNIPLFVRAKIS